jgi:hypothetical protein
VIRWKSSLRGELIVTANAEITIRSFGEADRLPQTLGDQVEERLSMGRALD